MIIKISIIIIFVYLYYDNDECISEVFVLGPVQWLKYVKSVPTNYKH